MLAEVLMTQIPKRIKNFIGFKFGDDCIVIGYLGQCGYGNDKSSQWLCECKCGNEFKLSRCRITNKKYGKICCPICARKIAIRKTIVPMVGKKFDRWLVLEEMKIRKNRAVAYLCRCNCGVIKIVSGLDLRDHTSKSCGCLARELSRQRRGILNGKWKSDMDDEKRELNKAKRNNNEVIHWRKQVFQRDHYICRCCGMKKSPFNAHHLNSWKDFPDQRYIVSNGLTLCVKCHKLFHKQYGWGNNTKEQYQEFFLLRWNG